MFIDLQNGISELYTIPLFVIIFLLNRFEFNFNVSAIRMVIV